MAAIIDGIVACRNCRGQASAALSCFFDERFPLARRIVSLRLDDGLQLCLQRSAINVALVASDAPIVLG